MRHFSWRNPFHDSAAETVVPIAPSLLFLLWGGVIFCVKRLDVNWLLTLPQLLITPSGQRKERASCRDSQPECAYKAAARGQAEHCCGPQIAAQCSITQVLPNGWIQGIARTRW